MQGCDAALVMVGGLGGLTPGASRSVRAASSAFGAPQASEHSVTLPYSGCESDSRLPPDPKSFTEAGRVQKGKVELRIEGGQRVAWRHVHRSWRPQRSVCRSVAARGVEAA